MGAIFHLLEGSLHIYIYIYIVYIYIHIFSKNTHSLASWQNTKLQQSQAMQGRLFSRSPSHIPVKTPSDIGPVTSSELKCYGNISGWWFLVISCCSWDDEIPNIWNHKNLPKRQPDMYSWLLSIGSIPAHVDEYGHEKVDEYDNIPQFHGFNPMCD